MNRLKSLIRDCLSNVGSTKLDTDTISDKGYSEDDESIKNLTDANNKTIENLAQNSSMNNPCLISWMWFYEITNFTILPNRSLYTQEILGGTTFDPDHYYITESMNNKAMACQIWIKHGKWETICMSFVILLTMITCVVYTLTPKLQNLQGLIFRSYLTTSLVAYVFALGFQLTTGSKDYAYLFTISEYCCRLCCAMCAFWLNVISFNMWRSFRSVRSINPSQLKEYYGKKFIWCAIYAWGLPIVLFGSNSLVAYNIPSVYTPLVTQEVKKWGSVTVLLFVTIVNVIFHTSTTITIKKHLRATAHVIDGAKKFNESWFNLYFKLFVIMGSNIVVWIIWLIWQTPLMLQLVATVEVIQTVLIFILFVWKDSVMSSLCIRLGFKKA